MRYIEVSENSDDTRRRVLWFFNPVKKWAHVTYSKVDWADRLDVKPNVTDWYWDNVDSGKADETFMPKKAIEATRNSQKSNIHYGSDPVIYDTPNEAQEAKVAKAREFQNQGYEVFGAGLTQAYWGGKDLSLANWKDVFLEVRKAISDVLIKNGFQGDDLERETVRMLQAVRANIKDIKTPADVKNLVKKELK